MREMMSEMALFILSIVCAALIINFFFEILGRDVKEMIRMVMQ